MILTFLQSAKIMKLLLEKQKQQQKNKLIYANNLCNYKSVRRRAVKSLLKHLLHLKYDDE